MADPAPLLRALAPGTEDCRAQLEIAGERCSRSRLVAAASRLARELEGAPAVAVEADATLETAVGVVAGLFAGAPVVPIPPDAGVAERDRILADSGAAFLLRRASSQAAPPPDGVTVLEVPPIAAGPEGGLAGPPPEPAATATALVLYTSGTTGPPKGVVLSRAAVAADLDALATAWDWQPDDVLVHGLPLFHVHGLVLGLLGALRVGCRLVHTGRPTPDAYAAAGGSLYFGVPTVWSRLCDDPSSAARLTGARLLVSGSAPLPAPVFDRLAQLTGAAPVERYGMTESLITLSTRAAGERRRGSVGLPLDGVEVRVVDDQGTDLPYGADDPGDLLVRGPTLFDGYLGLPEETAAVFTADGWMWTGDVASRDDDGLVRVVGRRSVDLIKVGGFRVGAGEVEDSLLAHPAVREAAVVGVPDADLGHVIVAYVVAEGVDEATLVEWVGQALARHKRPRRVVFLDALPRNPLGKVRKDLLS